MDIVYIKGLSVLTTIGVYERERNIRQTLRFDLELGCDISAAGQSDAVETALDYDAISQRMISFVEASQYALIEAVAENLAAVLLSEFPIKQLKLQVSKPGAISAAADVGVIIERRRDL